MFENSSPLFYYIENIVLNIFIELFLLLDSFDMNKVLEFGALLASGGQVKYFFITI